MFFVCLFVSEVFPWSMAVLGICLTGAPHDTGGDCACPMCKGYSARNLLLFLTTIGCFETLYIHDLQMIK